MPGTGRSARRNATDIENGTLCCNHDVSCNRLCVIADHPSCYLDIVPRLKAHIAAFAVMGGPMSMSLQRERQTSEDLGSDDRRVTVVLSIL